MQWDEKSYRVRLHPIDTRSSAKRLTRVNPTANENPAKRDQTPTNLDSVLLLN